MQKHSSFDSRYGDVESSVSNGETRPRASSTSDEADVAQLLLSLKKYCEAQKCVEMLGFCELYEEYLDRGAPKEINVSHEVRVPLESMSAKLKRGLLPDCLPEVFAPSFNEVRAMVLLNVYPSFKKDVEAKKKKGGLLGRK